MIQDSHRTAKTSLSRMLIFLAHSFIHNTRILEQWGFVYVTRILIIFVSELKQNKK